MPLVKGCESAPVLRGRRFPCCSVAAPAEGAYERSFLNRTFGVEDAWLAGEAIGVQPLPAEKTG